MTCLAGGHVPTLRPDSRTVKIRRRLAHPTAWMDADCLRPRWQRVLQIAAADEQADEGNERASKNHIDVCLHKVSRFTCDSSRRIPIP